MVKRCDLSLKSVVDGKKNLFFSVGQFEEKEDKIFLSYREDAASICITFCDENACIDREGDYSLHLPLKNGKTSQGELGINGNIGTLDIYTHKLCYFFEGNKFKVCLRYDILLGDTPQKMELDIQAKF